MRSVSTSCGNRHPYSFFTCIMLFSAFMLSTTHLSAQDYYWVNGSGAWSDYAGHWAKVPNPTGMSDYYTNVPGSGNDVYFGANGGVAYTVNVDAGSTVPKCKKMDWSAVPAGTVWGGSGSRIDIYGSTILSGNMSITFSGETHFTAFGTMNTILSNTVHFPNSLVFEGTIGGGWTLGDPFFADYFMYHYGGQLFTNGKMVTIGGSGQFQGFSPGKLDLGNSDVIVDGGGAAFFYAPLDFNAGTSNIIANSNCFIHGTYAAYSNTTTSHFYNVTFNNTSGGNFAYGSVDGTLKFKGFAILHGYGGTSVPVLNNAIFEDGALIYNAFDYNNLTLTAGKTYTIQNYYGTTGTDQTILSGGSITAVGAGTCSEFIRIKSWQYGTHFNLVNNSGANQTVHCVILEDCHATGTNTLTVNDGLDLGNTTGWIFVNPHGVMDLYWVGGDGDWDDPCHWTSNPAATVGDCNCVPNGATNVHFTANSGFTLDPLDIEWVSTPADASFIAFRDMDWSTVTGNPTFHSVYNVNKTSDQYIYGSLTYSPNMVQDFIGTTRFRGNNMHTLTSAGQTFKELVFFEGVGEISLQDAFTFTNGAPYYNDVYHLRGTIKTLGNTISLATNNSWQGNKDLNGGFVDQGAVLWLGEVGGNSSTVTLGGNAQFFAGYEAGKFHPVHSHIKGFPGGGTVTVTAENRPHDFWDVSFFGNSTGVFYGGISHKLTYDGCYANIANSSPNRLIHELEMKDDGEINGNQTFDILTLTGGNGYVLQNGSVQTITSGGSFNTTSDCEHYVTLTSGIPDKTSEIKKEGGGTLTINNVVLDNIIADLSTGASYLAISGVALGITTGWSINVPSARSLYWVGGDGDWSDAAHWSTTSGGSGGACPPTPLDNVFFNGSSGLNASNFVTISQLYAHCKDMDWTGVGNGTKLSGYNYLNIFGNFKLSTGVHYEIWFTYFRANQPATITSAGNKYYYTFFWNPDGDWTLTDDFETIQDVDVYHYYGTLRTNNHNIGVGRIWWGATPYYTVPGYTFSPTAKLFLGSSKIRIYPTSVWAAEFLVSYPVNNFQAGTSEIIFESGVYSTLYSPASSPLAFYDVTFKEKDGSILDAIILGKLLFEKNGIIYASNDIHEVEFKDNALFYGARNYHIMKFAPGKRYTFLAGYTQTLVPFNGVEGQFIAQGLPGQYIEMKSTDFNTPAIIHKDDYDGTSTCTKYLFLTAMKHTGTEDIYVPTPGGNVFNNTGWQFFPCNPCPATIPVLDPASITVGCPPGKAKLMLAGLKPDEWAIWYSDPAAMMNIVYNGGQPGPMGNMFMPTITGPATYYARVYSDGGLCESTVILMVNITTTTPPLVYNLFGGGALCTYSAFVVGVDNSQIGVQYQLLFNGNPIGSPLAGTGDSIIFPYQGLPGTYTVQAFIPGTACSVLMNGSITPTYSPALAPLMSLNAPGWVCEATSITVYENFGDAVSWAWTGPAGFSSNAQYPPPILNVGFANAGRYTCVVTGVNGCTNITSIDIAVIPKLQASLNVTPISCLGAMDGEIEVVASGGILPYSYNWIIGGQTTPVISNLGVGFYVVQVIDSSGLCESTLSTNLTDPPLTDVQATPDISLCAGAQSPGVLFSSQSPGVQFHWTNNNTSIGLGASGSGNIPAFTAMNSSGSPNIAVIVVTPSLNGCVGAPDTFRITVNAMPTVADPADQVVCNGSNTALVDFMGTPSNVGFVWTNDNPGIGLPASGAGHIASFTAINTGNTPQTATVSVTPTIPGFAYIPNTGTNDVSVVNTLTNTVVATIPVQTYPIGVSATPDGSKVYVTNTFSNTVSVINTATNTVIATVPVGDYPHGLRVSPDGSKVYVANEGFPSPSYTISVINTATNVVDATITVDYSPASFRFSPDGSKLYVANRYADNFSVINTATNTVITTVSGGDYPYVMGVRPDGTRLYIANLLSNDVSVVNTATNSIINTIPVGDHPVGLDVSPDGSKVYVSNYNANTVSVINTATNTVVATVPVGAGPHGINVSLDGSRIYVAQNGAAGGLIVINAATNVVEATIPVGSAPRALGNFLIGTPCAGTPQTFSITVNPTPTVTASPDQVVCKNTQTTAVNFSGAVSGTVFNWTNNNPSIGLASTGTSNIPAFTAQNTGTTPLVATIIVTPQFTANGITCTGVTDTFNITVNPSPTVTDPADQSVCAGQSTAAVNFSGTIPGTIFNWSNNTPGIGLAASGTGNIAAFTAINAGNAPVTATIIVTPFYSNAGVTCSGPSQMFTISVNPTPTVNQPANQVVCHNSFTTDINFSGSATGTVYRWTNNTPSIGLAANGVGNIPAFTATNTSTAPLVATITVTPEYTSNGLTCLGTAKTFSITVNPKPYVDGVLNQSYCNGATTSPIVFVGTVPGTVFNWVNFNTAIGLGASGTGNIPSFTATNPGTTPISAQIKVQAFYTNGGLTCAGNDTSFQIRVNPTPTVNQPVNQVICNANLTSAITFTGNATLYRWTNNTPSIGLAANGVGDIAAFNATNTGNAPLVATITVTPEFTANGLTCLGAAKTFTITVNPTPNVSDPADLSVCAGQLTAAINFSGTVTGTVFTWTNNNTAIGLGASGTGNIAAFTAINAGNTPVTATITVMSSYTNAGVTCSGSSQSFTITVNPLPATFNISGQTSYCSPGDPGAPLGLSGSQIGVNYQLWQGASPVGTSLAGTGAALNFGSFPAGTYTVVATQVLGGCSRTMTGSVAVQAFNCTVTVTDPCVCKNNATNLVNGQFDEFIKVNAPSWQNWTIKNIFGLYNLNSPAPPAAPIPVPVGTTLAGIGNNMFLLNGLHVDAIGYSVTVSNGFTDLSLPLTKCYYPDPVILDPGGPYCLYSPDVTLSAKVANNPAPNPGNLPHFTVNGTNYPATFNAGLGVWETTYDITALGNYTVGFSFDAGMSGPNNPNDPGCVQAAEPVIFNVIATPTTLSCNDLVYVSLDADCTTEILPDMILEGTYNCYDDYQVNIYTNTGLLVGDVVTADHLGQTLTVKIKHLPSGNICWGNLIVQDKIAPDIQCQGITIPCIITDYSPAHLSQLGLAGAYPTVTDCSNYTLTFVDVWHNLTCDSSSAYVVRTWTAKDNWGNSSTCNQYIYFRRVYLPEVNFPADVTLSCENANTTPQNTGKPYINDLGLQLPLFPEVGYCEFNIAYQDQLIPVCDGTHKILRHWILLDWCLPTTPVFPGPNPVEYTQIIKVLDVTGPVITCPTDLTVSTDPNNCCATVNLPDALVKDGCSQTNNISAMVTTFEQYTGEQTGMYSVGGTLTNFPGNNFWDLDTLGNWGFTPCLPIGNHVVMYTAQDDCGNTGTCSFHLTVRDLVPPIAVCDQYTVAAVTNDDPNDCYTPSNTCSGAGVAWVTAKTFDDGSTDNCSNLHLTVRRMAPYSDCITQLNDCEKVTATAESDSIKFYCCEVGSIQSVILRAYQIDVNGNPILDANGDPIFNECMVNVEVQDKVKPVCQAPNNTTVSCESFDPTLWGYGLPKFEDNCCLDTTKTYQNHCGLTHSANYTLFDTICNKGTITRTFRVWDCHGQTSQCTQRVTVQYEQDYYVKFPNDVVVNTCNGSGNYGVPVFFGKDCEQLGVAYEDHIVTLVPEACYRIERTWHVVNLCTYNANLPYTYIPNPRPNNAVLNPANLPGPIVSAPGTLAPWAPTVVKINSTDAVATNYSIFWSANVNGYEYKQQIYINDTEAPALNCPASPVAFCDLTPNDPGLWNETYWWDNTLGQHDLCEGPVDLSITTTDSCSGPNVNVWYRLYLDLDGDGLAETLVNSASVPTFGTIQFGNLNGPGTSRVFDSRPVVANQKWGFAIEQQVTGSQKTARVRWNTAQSTQQYVMPELPYGTHKIEWTVSDGCGNDRQCAYDFTVKDCKKPTVVCLNGLSVNIMPTQMVQLWASDFLKYTEDNCTPSNQLKIGIRKSGTGTGFPLDANGNPVTNVIFTCDELGTQLVEIWSMDKAGNADFCETYVLVQDNNHNCPAVTGAKVAGKLATEASDGVESGGVEIVGSSNAVPSFNFATMTDNAGAYNFNAIPLASNSTLTPNKDDNPLNGVSTYDLVLISKHILGIEPLNSPYKMIAADANKSGSITTFDIVEIRKLILGIYSELPYNTSWRFVDKDFVFPNPANPFETQFSENKLIQNLNSDRPAEDFVSVKVGDVNGTAIANALMAADDRSGGTLLFDVDDRVVQAGETFTVTLTPAQMTQGYQFTLNINGLEVLEVIGLKAENYAVFKDAVTFSVDGQEAAGPLALQFKALKSGKLSDMLAVSSRITKAEGYRISNNEQGLSNIERSPRLDIGLRFKQEVGTKVSGLGFELYQNEPNPFVDKTFVGFHLPEATVATLTIFDETGRIQHTQKADFPQGYNRFIIDGNKLPSTGILYYQVETATDHATMKMIRLR
jgi:YVTN family beta-propeller protein